MMMDFLRPQGPDEVCATLLKHGKACALHAGGTDLVVQLREHRRNVDLVVDLGRIDVLRTIRITDSGSLWIGCLSTLAEVGGHPRVRAGYHALFQAVHSIGSAQIRNRATLCGNVCTASPAADSLPALLIFDAMIHLLGPKGPRCVALQEFIIGPGDVSLGEGEFVCALELPKLEGEVGSAYVRLSRRKRVDLAIVSAAALANSHGNIRVAFGGAAPIPFRARQAEEFLSEAPLDQDRIDQAMSMVTPLLNPITDLRASKEYRQAMACVLGSRALNVARDRLQNNLGDQGVKAL